MEKKIFIDGENIKISDGYHSFDELYDHRCLLWINLCLLRRSRCKYIPDHYEGWFLLYMDTIDGQMSYHCPNKYLYLIENKIELSKEYIFDGHTSEDVLERLENLAK